eukprot:TRINITY_DN20248_c0_g1_i1.p1 TRINITY_DN20248_c0_g1~~TRINITY_DN20248_c0_g1_i1.p1  ORF type:complete len:311 (+),score=68.74 TRINITY_DN20248_c0_g1_i1:148-1080(+)
MLRSLVGSEMCIRDRWKDSGRVYAARIVGQNSDGSYNVLYDDGDFENMVPPERIVSTNDDDESEEDWFEDFHRLRQYTASSLLRACFWREVLARWHCAFWFWRRTSSLWRERCVRMRTGMSHLLNAQRVWELGRAVRQWASRHACHLTHTASLDLFKQDYSQLVLHIRSMEAQFNKLRIRSALSQFQATIGGWAQRAKFGAWIQWVRWIKECAAQAATDTQDKLKLQLNKVTRERLEALEELEQLGRQARGAIDEVQHLRSQLDERGPDLVASGFPGNHKSPSPARPTNRFQAFSNYSASLMADPGFPDS